MGASIGASCDGKGVVVDGCNEEAGPNATGKGASMGTGCDGKGVGVDVSKEEADPDATSIGVKCGWGLDMTVSLAASCDVDASVEDVASMAASCDEPDNGAADGGKGGLSVIVSNAEACATSCGNRVSVLQVMLEEDGGSACDAEVGGTNAVSSNAGGVDSPSLQTCESVICTSCGPRSSASGIPSNSLM